MTLEAPVEIGLQRGARLRFHHLFLTNETDTYPFGQILLTQLNEQLVAEGKAPLSRLEDIHTIGGIAENIEHYRQYLFTTFRSADFQRVYQDLGRHVIDKHFTEDALLQKTPTARIQLPDGGRSVSYHTDGWYGHGAGTYSFWVPMVAVWGSNSLQMASSVERSLATIAEIEERRLDLRQINALAEQVCQPVRAEPGTMIGFSSAMIHGTGPNHTGSPRVSFDFRIADNVDEIGTKPPSNYYTYADLIGSGTDTGSRARTRRPRPLMYSGICRGISAKSQLVFLNEYARLNDLDIAGSESEIVTMSHAPVLQSYLKYVDETFDSVLAFGVDLLPADRDVRQHIYGLSLANEIPVIFAAEDIELRTQADIAVIERLLA